MPDLTDRKELKAFLERHGLWPKKSLSQHFLCSSTVVDAILERLSEFRGVLEIGPGPGVLTHALCGSCEKVAAIEIDARMRDALTESAACAQIVFADALSVDWRPILDGLAEPRAVVSNMPYGITGPLLGRAAEYRRHFSKAILMMQKEVANRVLAPPRNSDRGSLSVFLQAQFEIDKVCSVPPGAFLPPPIVESAVLQLVPKVSGLSSKEEEQFFGFVRSGFRMPRKTLANNLMKEAGERLDVQGWLRSAGLDPRARPQDPDLDQWRRIWESAKTFRGSKPGR